MALTAEEARCIAWPRVEELVLCADVREDLPSVPITLSEQAQSRLSRTLFALSPLSLSSSLPGAMSPLGRLFFIPHYHKVLLFVFNTANQGEARKVDRLYLRLTSERGMVRFRPVGFQFDGQLAAAGRG